MSGKAKNKELMLPTVWLFITLQNCQTFDMLFPIFNRKLLCQLFSGIESPVTATSCLK